MSFYDKILMSAADRKKEKDNIKKFKAMSTAKPLPKSETIPLDLNDPAGSYLNAWSDDPDNTYKPTPSVEGTSENTFGVLQSNRSDKNIEGGDVEAAIMQQYAKAGKVPPLEKAAAKKVLDKGKKSSKPTNWEGISQKVAAGLVGAAEAAAEEKEAVEKHNRGVLADQMTLRADASRARGKALSGLQKAFAQLIR